MVIGFKDWCKTNKKELHNHWNTAQAQNANSFARFLLETQDKKNPIQVTTSMPQYPTGYMYMDYGAGSYLTVSDGNDPMFMYHNIGMSKGVYSIISKSQGGKTTLSLGLGAAIIEPYISKFLYNWSIADTANFLKMKTKPEVKGMPFIQILDSERTASSDYAQKITRFSSSLAQECIIINPVTTDKDVIRNLEKHVQYKVSTMEKIPMPMLDTFGKPVMEYPITIIVLDSTSQLMLEDCDDPEAIAKAKKDGIADVYAAATQNTSGARRAKVMSALFSTLVNYAAKYNILIFAINHINHMLPINGIPVKQYRGLKAGESLNNGERAVYLATGIYRLDVIKGVGTTKSTQLNLGPDVHGFVSLLSIIKSKCNSKSNTCQIVYTNRAGYDPILSNLYYAKEQGHLSESGHNLYIPGYEDYKFNLKNYNDVFADNPILFTALYDHLRDKCAPLLDNQEDADRYNRRMIEQIRKDNHDDYSDGSRADREDMMDMDDLFKMAIND